MFLLSDSALCLLSMEMDKTIRDHYKIMMPFRC